jgi:hypothetical protein
MHQPTPSGVYARGNGIPKRAKAYPTPRNDNTAQAKKNEKAGCISCDFFRRRAEKVQLQPGKCPVRCQEVLGAFSAAGLPFRGGLEEACTRRGHSVQLQNICVMMMESASIETSPGFSVGIILPTLACGSTAQMVNVMASQKWIGHHGN